MADLKTTIGIDLKELEKGLTEAGRMIGGAMGQGKSGYGGIKNPFAKVAGDLSSAQGIGGLVGGPIGAMVGAVVDAFAGMVKAVIAKISEIAEYAKTIRLASLRSGMDISQIKQFESIGQTFGVSLQTMMNSAVEFTRRMGEARIKGGELTNILAKMGVGMDEVSDGTFDANKAMKALSDSYAAGTDEATLLYYGTAADSYLTANAGAVGALARGKSDMEKWGQLWDNFWINLIGSVFEMIEEIQFSFKNFFSTGAWNPFESVEDEVKRKVENAPKYMTNDEIKDFVLREIDEDKREQAKKELEKLLKGKANILNPFGLAEAGAASQMQQMGGGDVFGAVSFTPLERIATATEETARNTRPELAPSRTPDALTR